MHVRTLLAWTLVALGAGALLLWRRVSALRRRRQREATWRELCLRLELTGEPGAPRAASGRWQDAAFLLRDTGSVLHVEVPLPEPLVPPGVVLLSHGTWRLRRGLRPLRLRPAPGLPGAPAWFTVAALPPSEAEVRPAFLEEAQRAAQAHAPLRVESGRLVQALAAPVLPSVQELRDAVRALQATAQRWLDTVRAQGLPRVEALPRGPSALSLLRGVLAQRELWRWLLLLNGGIPLTVATLLLGWTWAFFGLLIVGLIYALARRDGYTGMTVGLLAVATTFGAPGCWSLSVDQGTRPPVLSVRDAHLGEHRRASHFRFHDAVILSQAGHESVVPIVPADWQPGELVNVWATRLPTAPSNGLRLGGTEVGTRRHIDSAVLVARKHQFPMAAHSVFLDMSVHPDDLVVRRRLQAGLLWGVPHALWLGVVLVRWRRAFRAHSSAGSHARLHP